MNYSGKRYLRDTTATKGSPQIAAVGPDAPTELTLAELVEANASLVACFTQLRAERDQYRTRLARLVALLERDPVRRKRVLRELRAHDHRSRRRLRP